MQILFYRYGSICEPDLLSAFSEVGITVQTAEWEIYEKDLRPSARVEQLAKLLKKEVYLFVFSVNFFPSIADLCQVLQIPYVCWTVDAPIQELFSPSLAHSTNRIFLFDRAQYEYFHPVNPNSIFYLPLAGNPQRVEQVIRSFTGPASSYAHDISMVASLYSEKNPYRKLQGLSDYARGYVQGVVHSSLYHYGENILDKLLPQEILEEFAALLPDPSPIPLPYYVANHIIGMQLAETERITLLNILAKTFDTHLYTLSDCSALKGVNCHEGIKTLTQMPLAFHYSRINLNMTIKPIATGLPLRIFDILSCGGFMISNFQSEIPEYFTIGKDLETYSCPEELTEKAAYYLSHEEERSKIALSGLAQVKQQHTYAHRIKAMITTLHQSL